MLHLAVHADNLTKVFPKPRRLLGLALPFAVRGGTLAVDGVSVGVERGEIFGLVGPNGAGKTTLVKMLSTLILPTDGSAWVNGHALSDGSRIKSSIGLVTGSERGFYPRLSCRENLRFYAGLHDLFASQAERRIAELADLLELGQFLDKRFDTCSTGMKRRLALARSLLNDPRLLFLDEPTRSLDPLAAVRFRDAVCALAHGEGRTVFLVTHDLEEAVELCDRVGVMLRGRLRAAGAPQRLRQLLKPRAGRVAEGDEGNLGQVGTEAASWESVFQALGAAQESEFTPSLAAETPPPVPEGVEQERALGLAGLREAFRKPLLFLRRDLKTQMRYRLSFVLQLLGILFSSATFYFVAQLFGSGVGPDLSGYEGGYFSFVLIGIAFAGYQSVALYSFSSVVRSAQVTGTLETMLVTPTRLSTILLSSCLWNFTFTSLRVVLYLLAGVALFGVDLRQANLLAALIVLGLTILALSGIGILSACFIMVFKRGSPINFLIGSLSTLLGGVYYPLQVLPPWLQALARLFPLTYSLEAMRRALLAGETALDLAMEIGVLAAFSAALLPLGLLAFRYAVRQAKRDGSLTQF